MLHSNRVKVCWRMLISQRALYRCVRLKVPEKVHRYKPMRGYQKSFCYDLLFTIKIGVVGWRRSGLFEQENTPPPSRTASAILLGTVTSYIKLHTKKETGRTIKFHPNKLRNLKTKFEGIHSQQHDALAAQQLVQDAQRS